jgi:hypothetical protein
MKQGLFLDGINVPGNKIAVNKGIEDSPPVFAHRAYSAAAVLNHTTMTAKTALDFFVLQRFPEIGFHDSSKKDAGPYAGFPV